MSQLDYRKMTEVKEVENQPLAEAITKLQAKLMLHEAPEKVFGKNLKEVMDFLEINQVELATKAGITQAAVSQILSGDREPSFGTIVKILNVIPVKFERLLK